MEGASRGPRRKEGRKVRGRQEGNVAVVQEKRGGPRDLSPSRTHNAGKQPAEEQIRHVFKYNTDSLASRQSMAEV